MLITEAIPRLDLFVVCVCVSLSLYIVHFRIVFAGNNM